MLDTIPVPERVRRRQTARALSRHTTELATALDPDAPPNRATRRARPPQHTRVAVFPEGRKVVVHTTQTPPWLVKAARRAANAVARQSRKANRP